MSELYHHGILGQKWGVRRTPEQLGYRKQKREERKNKLIRSSGSTKSDTFREAQKQDISKLTNKQLKDYNERLQLEQNFARLTSGKVKQGKDWVAKTVVSGIVVGSIATVTKQVVQAWLKGQFGIG